MKGPLLIFPKFQFSASILPYSFVRLTLWNTLCKISVAPIKLFKSSETIGFSHEPSSKMLYCLLFMPCYLYVFHYNTYPTCGHVILSAHGPCVHRCFLHFQAAIRRGHPYQGDTIHYRAISGLLMNASLNSSFPYELRSSCVTAYILNSFPPCLPSGGTWGCSPSARSSIARLGKLKESVPQFVCP